ncbi:hypothetical protein AJ80_04676 [Polytolypa hystricis UAMH7299]|uniref:Uncharacterized protein n=1 Tax=Polytolypa hystricis (strain UAMH7299) TaxID=1447883 RepID=A0A2B7Y9Y7_POLH7|nr:hypothetical protein AJ80_04676 [Polytolypa hystricis UAMH7299]
MSTNQDCETRPSSPSSFCFLESDTTSPSCSSNPADDIAMDDDFLTDRRLSTFERVISTHAPILESILLQSPTISILQLYHTSQFLRSFLRSYPTAWQYLSFRLIFPLGTRPPVGQDNQRQSRPYALDQLLLQVVLPFSPCLRSLDLDNTAVSGQNLTSTVLNMRRDTLEHLSVRGCKNVSLKYHIIPYLTMFGLQYDADLQENGGTPVKRLALKSLYTYRCRHHRRRPYLSSSLHRKDSDSEPTHELVKLCYKLGIWTDSGWCTTPAGRCFRRRGYVSMRAPQGTPEVWVVFDRLWRSKNWVGPTVDRIDSGKRDVRIWEHEETGCEGEALGTANERDYGEGKTVPAHLRRSHTHFIENIKCDGCLELISERCEQCSVLMHCVGCRKTLCASCAFDRPYLQRKLKDFPNLDTYWWAPGATISPCSMQEPNMDPPAANQNNNNNGPQTPTYPTLKFHWCCTEPLFTGGGGISITPTSQEVDRIRAAPLPRGQGWEDPEYSSNEWSRSFPKNAYGDPKHPDYTLAAGHIEMMRWLLGPPNHQVSTCPRNLCRDCFDSPQWKVHCKSCSRPLCMEHDLRGQRLRICGYRDLQAEKRDLENEPPYHDGSAVLASTTFADYRGPSAQIIPPPVPTHIPPPPPPIHGASSTNQPNPIPDSNSMVDRSSAVQTPTSTSNNHSRSSSPASVYFEASPDTPKWLGCQSFFCPQYRAFGDQRQRCTSILRECAVCSIHVCQDCIRANPPCKCSYCELNYLCPNCYPIKEREGLCRRVAEERAKLEEQQRRDLEMLEVTLERNLANEVAAFAGQFFGSLLLDDARLLETHASDADDEREEVSGPQAANGGPANNTQTQIQGQAPAAQPPINNAPIAYDDNDHPGSCSEHTEPLGEE